jgi:hypothetical protein
MNEDGKCSKNFPKNFCDETIVENGNYTEYRRRKGPEYLRGNHFINNQWVVPYNPYLSKKYNCHINVEACMSVNAVKYINKYINKQGYDVCTITVNEKGQKTCNYNEISSYLGMRYVGPSESIWRLFGFRLYYMTHSVEILSVHLERQNLLRFEQGKEKDALANYRETTLTAYYKLNRQDKSATIYAYPEIVKSYWFDHRKSCWVKRTRSLMKTNKTLSRLCMVSPMDVSRYALRLLLLHVKGPTCEEDLRRDWDDPTIIYNTLEEAARRNGLLFDDLHWIKCLEEARMVYMPSQLRNLYCTIIMHNECVDARGLWLANKEFLSEDIFLREKNSAFESERMALSLINNEIQGMNPTKTLADFKFELDEYCIIQEDLEDLLTESEVKDLPSQIDLLNPDQRLIYDLIMSEVFLNEKKKTNNVFIDGPGGTGKTFLYNVLIRSLMIRGKNVMALAYTGIAANLLKGGRTIHSCFGISIHEPSIVGVKPNSTVAKRMRETDLFLFDEATLISTNLLRTIDITLRDITNVHLPFGGKFVLLGGDFRQCLPIIHGANRHTIVQNCLKSSYLWRDFSILPLTQNIRSSEKIFSEFLMMVGNGGSSDKIHVPKENLVFSIAELIERVFDGFNYGNSLRESLHISQRCILSTTNKSCLEINDLCLDKFGSFCEKRTYLSVDSAICGAVRALSNVELQSNFDVSYLNTVITSGLPPHKLELKVGAPVILIRNLNVRKGLCNGTKLIVTRLFKNSIEARKLNCDIPFVIPRVTLIDTDPDLPFNLKRIQFPIRLAFSMTINKSQGQTFDKVGIDLREQCFGHGQLYVALSRVRRQQDFVVYSGQSKDEDDFIFHNVVYREILK